MIKRVKLQIGNFGVRVILFIARKAKIDLIRLGYRENGYLKSHSLYASGEEYFTAKHLPKIVKNQSPVIIDVGANVGEYSQLLVNSFPHAKLYSFEPNPSSFAILIEKLGPNSSCINQGLGEQTGTLPLYYAQQNKTSVQATSNSEILSVIARTENLEKVEIKVTTLDEFCHSKSISNIDFLKIDTEGFELEVLKGGCKIIQANKVKVIQFEFNEVNIVKRRFLKDFYEQLPNYDFYRLDTRRLIPIKNWEPIHEVFMFQNIICILK